MRCQNCNTEINDNIKFCYNCGTKIQKNEVMQPKMPEQPNYNQKIFSTKLSIISVVCFSMQLITPRSSGILIKFEFLFQIPWTLISLVLAIISKCKFNDKMSKIMIIVNCVFIITSIILLIILMFLFSYLDI